MQPEQPGICLWWAALNGHNLGGAVGVGTLLYAVAIGPLAQLMLPWFTVDLELPVAEADDGPLTP